MTAQEAQAAPVDDADGPEAAWETAQADAVLAAQDMSAGIYLAGFISAGRLKSAGTSQALLKDVWQDVDPDVVRAIFERGCATGWMGAQLSQAPRLHGRQLAELQDQLKEAGFVAMGRGVGRSLRLVAPHPADGEGARPGNGRCDKRTTDTGEGDQDR